MNEQAKVGLVVLVSVVLLTAAGFAIANMHFGGNFNNYKCYFKFAGGLEVGGGTPVGADSSAQVTQLTMLSENYVEITPGKQLTPLPNGSVVPSKETQTLNALIDKLSGVADQAKPLIDDLHNNLNQISKRADGLLANLQELTGEKNRAHVSSGLAELDDMLKENRPKMTATMSNLQTASAQMDPLMHDLRETTAKVQKVLDTANGMLDEDRDKIKGSLDEMQKALAAARQTIEQLQTMLIANGDNVDVMLDNFRQVSDNFREFTDQVKRQPSSLIWKDTHPDRKPPSAPKGKDKPGKDEHP